MLRICRTQWLGHIEYAAALNLQKELVAWRAIDEIPDTLLLLEHPSTYTVGIDGHQEHLLINLEELAHLNVAFHRVDCGGSVTYHGPGQLVCYPILNLREHGYNYHEYIKLLESVIIRTLATFNVRAFRQRGQPGVWVFGPRASIRPDWGRPESGMAQIASIGVKLNPQNITSHGFAININPDLKFFDQIMPSGLHSCQITSLSRLLNKSLEIGFVIEPVIQSFCEVFGLIRETTNPIIGQAVVAKALLPTL